MHQAAQQIEQLRLLAPGSGQKGAHGNGRVRHGSAFPEINRARSAVDSDSTTVNSSKVGRIPHGPPFLNDAKGGSCGSECGKNATGSRVEFASNLSSALIWAQLEC